MELGGMQIIDEWSLFIFYYLLHIWIFLLKNLKALSTIKNSKKNLPNNCYNLFNVSAKH